MIEVGKSIDIKRLPYPREGYRQAFLGCSNTRLRCWLSPNSKLKEGKSISLKGDERVWQVLWLGGFK